MVRYDLGARLSGSLRVCPGTLTTHASSEIEQAIQESLPTRPGRRHRQVLELARALNAIPTIHDASANSLE